MRESGFVLVHKDIILTDNYRSSPSDGSLNLKKKSLICILRSVC